VFVSAAHGHWLCPGYISTKREVEEWLEEHRETLKSSVIRPGVMYSYDDPLRKAASFITDVLSH
jgi:hypothetical protein